ncbi:MAG: hypothetical protein KGQ54_04615, partial [Verrucomicrobia bacterium]|nr:hypothetical protein [Verrucomicrobiota bacterium]
MSDDRVQRILPSSDASQKIRQQQIQQNATQLAEEIIQEASEEEFQEWCDNAFNPVAANKYAQELSKRPRPRLQGSPQRPSYSSRRSVRG